MKDSAPRVKESGGLVTIGNGLLELGFDTRRAGALASIVDGAGGWQFVRHPDASLLLFRLALRRGNDRAIEWFSSADAGRFAWAQRSEADGAVTLAMTAAGFRRPGLTVVLEISLAPASALSAWRMRVEGVGEDAVFQAVYPAAAGVLKAGAGVPGEAIAVPRQSEGYVFHDPFPVVDNLPLKAGPGPESPSVGIGEIHGKYPGAYPMQLLLYYTPKAGMYLACHDAGQHVKSFDVGPVPEGDGQPVLSISHFAPETMGRGTAFTYETMLGVFHGDWYDGADIYKAWARKQWWCAKKLVDKDIAPWMKSGVGVFQMQNYDTPVLKLTHSLDEIADIVNREAAAAGAPLLALVFNFENGGAWTGPVGFFPPREGEEPFRAAMEKLRGAGNHGFVYMPGGNWYIAISSYSPPFDSTREFEEKGRPAAIMNAEGTVTIMAWYEGWKAARICPRVPFTREVTEELILGAVKRGCPVVQIDNFPCGGADACHDPGHGHPLGFGPWWSEDWNAILEGVRGKARALDADAALSTEGISENFILHLDLYDQRAANMEYFGHYQPGDPMGGELIPIFGYVYGGYIGAYTAAYPECSRPEVLYWARCFGKSLAQGVIPTGGWYLPDQKGLNPRTTAFFRTVVRAAARECWKYVVFGEMLKPPAIDVPEVEFSYQRLLDLIDFPKRNAHLRHVVKDKAVQSGSFRAADGSVGHIFVNVTADPVAFAVELPAYGATARAAVDAVRNGKRTRLKARARLPVRLDVGMEPFSVLLLEVTEAEA